MKLVADIDWTKFDECVEELENLNKALTTSTGRIIETHVDLNKVLESAKAGNLENKQELASKFDAIHKKLNDHIRIAGRHSREHSSYTADVGSIVSICKERP